MPWEFAMENVATGEAPIAAGLPMDNDAFAGFYQRSARPLWAYLARVSGDAALADDLMQESFVRFLCADAPQDGEVAARRYLFRIGTNLLKDHWRRAKSTPIDDVPEELFAVGAGTGPGGTGQSEAQAMLAPAMKALRPRDRQLLWLAYAEGYSHREIAEVTGLASASIRLLLFRARRRVAAFLRNRAAGKGGAR